MPNQLTGAAAGMQDAIESMGALTRLRGQQMELSKQNSEAAGQRNFLQRMEELKNPAAGMLEQLDTMSQAAMDSGQVEKATGFSEKAAALRYRMAQLASSKIQDNERQLDQGHKTINLLGQFLQGATDQSSWDRGNSLFTRLTGQTSPYADMPFNPKLVGELQSQAVSVKQMADLQAKNSNQQTLDAARQSSIDFRNERLRILEREQELRAQHRASIAKVGGKVVGAPAKGEIDESAALLKRSYDNLPNDEIADHAYVVASRARALRSANPGLDASTSMNQAMAELNLKNPPGILDRMYGVLKGTSVESADGALPLPKTKDALVVGQIYTTAKGTGKWTGTGFQLVQPGVSAQLPLVGSTEEDAILGDEGEE